MFGTETTRTLIRAINGACDCATHLGETRNSYVPCAPKCPCQYCSVWARKSGNVRDARNVASHGQYDGGKRTAIEFDQRTAHRGDIVTVIGKANAIRLEKSGEFIATEAIGNDTYRMVRQCTIHPVVNRA